MEMHERLGWLLLGCFVGYILGYIVRGLRDIKEEVDEIDDIVKQDHMAKRLEKNDDGFMRIPVIQDVALLLVVVLTVWAAFASQRASNDIQDTQDRLSRVTVCNQQFLSKTITALNERTSYTAKQASKNVELQRAQAAFLAVVVARPPSSEQAKADALDKYFNALTDFVIVSGQTEDKVVAYPYPTNQELNGCLNPNK